MNKYSVATGSFTLFTKGLTNIKHMWYAKNIRIPWDQLSSATDFTIFKTIILKQTDYRLIV